MLKDLKNIGTPILFLEKIVKRAINKQASDIHLNPFRDHVKIRLRIMGKIIPYYELDLGEFNRVLNVIKEKAGINVNDTKNPHDGKMSLEIDLNKKTLPINLRISTLPTIFGENVVIRIIVTNNENLNIYSLGFSQHNMKKIEGIKNLKSGLILSTGGTGSGKTTTLYSLLGEFDPLNNSIYTLEDPVEYIVNGYIQSEVKESVGKKGDNYTFSTGLKGLLRQDPDIILVGEIRGFDTASICLEASNTGHLVLGSIHANDALSVISRMRQIGLKSFIIAGGIKYIINQKLVNKLCPKCLVSKKIKISDFISNYKKFNFNETTVYTSSKEGCIDCDYTGFKGLALLSEVLKIDEEISNMIFNENSLLEIKETLEKNNFLNILDDGILKSKNKEVDFFNIINLFNS